MVVCGLWCWRGVVLILSVLEGVQGDFLCCGAADGIEDEVS